MRGLEILKNYSTSFVQTRKNQYRFSKLIDNNDFYCPYCLYIIYPSMIFPSLLTETRKKTNNSNNKKKKKEHLILFIIIIYILPCLPFFAAFESVSNISEGKGWKSFLNGCVFHVHVLTNHIISRSSTGSDADVPVTGSATSFHSGLPRKMRMKKSQTRVVGGNT